MSAFKQVDVVISAVGTAQLPEQSRIVAAIKEAGNVKVRRGKIVKGAPPVAGSADRSAWSICSGSSRRSSATTSTASTPRSRRSLRSRPRSISDAWWNQRASPTPSSPPTSSGPTSSPPSPSPGSPPRRRATRSSSSATATPKVRRRSPPPQSVCGTIDERRS